MTRELWITGEPEADALLSRDANALVIGMLLDQQYPMERAFLGPWTIGERMGGRFDLRAIAAMAPEDFREICAAKPAIHRYPGSMAERIQDCARVLVEEWGGDAERLFDAPSGAVLYERIEALPGFGERKARILLALLGKQWGVAPRGWKAAAGEFAKEGRRSVADVTSEETLQEVRAFKQKQKARAKKRAAAGAGRGQ